MSGSKYTPSWALWCIWWALLLAHRRAFRQERVFWRMALLALAQVLALGRKTVTQLLLTLGMVEGDWSPWHRLFSRARLPMQALWEGLLKQVTAHVPCGEWLVVAVDEVRTARTGHQIEGVQWLLSLVTAPFARGFQRMQRWVSVAWLIPPEQGFSRALPLGWQAAFGPSAHCRVTRPRKVVEAALEALAWLRARRRGRLLAVLDGAFDTAAFWNGLPEGVVALVRTARNRVLYHLPQPARGRGRPRRYGPRGPQPHAVALTRGKGRRAPRPWKRVRVQLKGQERRFWVHVSGPWLVRGVPDRPLFLVVIAGRTYRVGRRRVRRRYREPVYWLVSAVRQGAAWALPLPVEQLVAWAWHRWEIEVMHRELKSLWGLTDKPAWSPWGSLLSVAWSAWLYGLTLLAAYRAWGLVRGPRRPEAWWGGARRWSLTTLLRALRQALLPQPHFQRLCFGSGPWWEKKEPHLQALANAALAASPL